MSEKLLFIAPTVPLFDIQSGDLRLFSVLNILSKSYDITYVARQWAGEKSLEDERYVSRLRDLGMSVYVEEYSIKDIIRSNRYKAAILEFYYIAEYYLPRVKMLQPTCPVIVDTVDVHYLRFRRKYELTKDEKDLRVAETARSRELAIYGQADIILTVSEEDGRSVQKDNPDVSFRVLPNVHPLVPPAGARNRHEMIFVGGFNHDPNIDAVLYFCAEILPGIRKAIPDAKFTVVGSNPPEQVRNLGNAFVTVTGFVPSTTPYLKNACISVAPLRYGAGMKGKIGEAMAHGLPVVTTTVGAEGIGLTDRENVLIADSPEAFSGAVIELMRDEVLYDKIRKNSLEHIENNFTPEKVGNRFEQILEEFDGLPARKMSLSHKASFLMNYARDHAKRMLTGSD